MSRTIRIALLSVSLIMLIPMLALSGNSNDFEVSSYIPEHFSDLVWTIDGRFNLSGNDQERDTDVAPGYGYPDQDSDRSENQQAFWLNTDATYYYETIKRQFELNLGFRSDLAHHHYENEAYYVPFEASEVRFDDTEKSRLNYTLNPHLEGTIRQYAGDQFFGEFSMFLDYIDDEVAYNDGYTYGYRHVDYGDLMRSEERWRDYESSSGTQQVLGNFKIAGGFGHVYEGSFASTAMHILDQIRDDGLLRREPSKAQMLELTEIVYYFRQTHAIDERYHRQDALNEIVDYLIDERIARDLTAQVLYAIQDVWDYFPSRKVALRLFGFRFKGGIGYVTSYDKHSSTLDQIDRRIVSEFDPDNPQDRTIIFDASNPSHSHQETKVTDEVPFFFASGEYHDPINHLWQFDASAEVEVNLEDTRLSSRTRRLRDIRNRFYTTTSLSRFFDNRTTVRASVNSRLYFGDDDVPAEPSDPTYPDTRHVWFTDFTISTGLSVLYRIAIPTTLDVTASFTSQFVRDPGYSYNYSDDRHSYSITARITHFIY